MLVEVMLLDGSPLQLEVSGKTTGEELMETIGKSINLLEKDYFGLTHYDKKDQVRVWVQNDRRLTKQMKEPLRCWFQVRFYPPDPAHLQEDLTRYQLCLQIQQDVKSGKLPCSFVTHALLGAYLIQSELGDYDPVDHGLETDYIRDFDFAPSQSEDLLERIMEVHKTLKGQSPAEAELHYLDNAKKLAMYGVSLHPARDSEGVDIMLGVCSSGILVYRDKLRINRFAWPKIIKISYKRNGFYIKIRPGEFEHFESTIGFKLENHKAAKRLWKICVEHHSFFRLLSPDQKEKPKFPRFGSRFRYSGRTQHQAKKNISMTDRTNPAFDRSGSHGKGAPGSPQAQQHSTNLSSQSMQGISPGRSPRLGEQQDSNSPPQANLENPANKRHTVAGHNLPQEVHRELEEAQNRRNLRNTEQEDTMSKSYPADHTQTTDQARMTDLVRPVPAVPQPRAAPAVPQPRARTPPMSSMDRPPLVNGHGGGTGMGSPQPPTVPTYSPAYQSQHGGPFSGGRRSPKLNAFHSSPPPPPRYDEPAMDYVTSATSRVGLPSTGGVGEDSEIVDIDEALGNPDSDEEGVVDIDDVLDRDPESTFQFSATESLSRDDDRVVRETEQRLHNLRTGETSVSGVTNSGQIDSRGDHVRATSVTTRAGTITQDRETGASRATMETRTQKASLTTSKEGASEETRTTKQVLTEAASSSVTSRKESTLINSTGGTNLDEIAATLAPAKEAGSVAAESVGDTVKGEIVSSQTITSKSKTVETTTYAIEQEGATETHIEQKVTIQSDGDPIDHDEALAQAIQEATAMNPDFTVEKIEINQTSAPEPEEL